MGKFFSLERTALCWRKHPNQYCFVCETSAVSVFLLPKTLQIEESEKCKCHALVIIDQTKSAQGREA